MEFKWCSSRQTNDLELHITFMHGFPTQSPSDSSPVKIRWVFENKEDKTKHLIIRSQMIHDWESSDYGRSGDTTKATVRFFLYGNKQTCNFLQYDYEFQAKRKRNKSYLTSRWTWNRKLPLEQPLEQPLELNPQINGITWKGPWRISFGNWEKWKIEILKCLAILVSSVASTKIHKATFASMAFGKQGIDGLIGSLLFQENKTIVHECIRSRRWYRDWAKSPEF